MAEPIKVKMVGEGRRQLQVAEEVDRLRGLGWRELRQEADELDVPRDVVDAARDRDEVRQAILEAKLKRQLF